MPRRRKHSDFLADEADRVIVTDPALRDVVAAWPRLSLKARQAVIAIITSKEAADEDDEAKPPFRKRP